MYLVLVLLKSRAPVGFIGENMAILLSINSGLIYLLI